MPLSRPQLAWAEARELYLQRFRFLRSRASCGFFSFFFYNHHNCDYYFLPKVAQLLLAKQRCPD